MFGADLTAAQRAPRGGKVQRRYSVAVGAGSSSERSGIEKRRLRQAKKAAGSKQSTTKAEVTFEATFPDEGPLGIVWSQTSGTDGDSLAAVKAIKPGSVAEESDVAVGMLLGEIGGEDMRGVDYCECKHAA